MQIQTLICLRLLPIFWNWGNNSHLQAVTFAAYPTVFKVIEPFGSLF